MSSDKTSIPNINFLQGGGEMGHLTRSFQWAGTPIGSIEQWPQSLRISLGIVLHSAFPMFLFWGKDLVCFYNDAFRPSLGQNGKHPAVGKPAREVWQEIWDFIGPLIQQVMSTGEAVWFEDQYVPFYRNGRIEDIYWTFSYSPVFGDSGDINGVMVTCTETTKKVQMVNSLLDSEKRFQNLISNATIGIVVLQGDDLVVETANDAYGKLIGQDHNTLTGRPLFEVIPETEPYFRKIIETVRDQGEPTYLYDQPYFVFVDGVKREGFLNLVYQPYKRDDNETDGVMILCHDVTEQVIARKKIEDTEQKVLSFIQSAPFPIGVYVGEEMEIELVNQSIIDVWGKGSDIVGKRYADVLPELDNQIYGQLHEVYTKGIPFHARNQRVDLLVDGSMRPYYFNYSFTPLYDSAGKVYGVMNTAADVTELNLAKIRVEESGQNLRNIILKAPVAMCIFKGPEFVVEIANERMVELWGKTFADVMNKPIFEGLPESKDQGFEQLLENVFSTGEAFSAQGVPITLPRNNKLETVYVNFLYEAYRENDSSISGVIAVALDVTDQVVARKQIEKVVAERTQELAEANSNLKKSNAELAQFAYIASHDLQEPVRKVNTYIQMLEDSLTQVDAQSKNYLDKIKKSSSRMLALIRDVLAYSQLSRDKEILKPVNLDETIREIKYDLELLMEQKNAIVNQQHLPVIEAIPLQMSQLFANLISNALKFSRTDARPTIGITCADLKPEDVKGHFIPAEHVQYFHIQVKDNGIGFDQEHAEQIFSIFQRLHGKQQYEGTGIGLALCRKIMENHQGCIFADSVKGSGTTFHVIIPEKQIDKSLHNRASVTD